MAQDGPVLMVGGSLVGLSTAGPHGAQLAVRSDR